MFVISGTVCLIVCFGVSGTYDWGNGIQFGTTVGIGVVAEASVGLGAGVGNLNGPSVECSGIFGPYGGYGSISLTSFGVAGGWSGGLGGGCAIMFSTYR
ncbi:hypothetical protein GCM10023346_40820 [Arthrobacter gyeryongensis]|uniref:Uncharacterized protein n=1 Tax=Arthrobacter gyeryongensis TaxID=1650592 RepID=A0ABP9SSG1_9MICC